ncbi:MAG: glycosyltransferase family 39 protein [Candidatus Omnitrophica bacterium]|nr:glycosyltransferase family 39 protein [Candidatus Omnitrophota bacterium]
MAFGLGFSGFSILLFVFGLFGGLQPAFLIPASVLLTPMAAWGLWTRTPALFHSVRRTAAESPFGFGLVTILGIIYFLGVCVPEREEDAIWYHLGIPIFYLFHGGFIQEVPFNLPSHYPMYGQLHYTLSLAVGNDSTAKAFSFCQFFPALILIVSTLKQLGHSRGAVYGCVLYLCCAHFRLPTMANVQRTVFFFTLLSMVLLWTSLNRRSFSVFVLASFFCGMAMGVKMNALLFCYLAQVLLILGWLLFNRPGWRNSLTYLSVHSGISWLVFSPWLIKSYMITGNPLYPMLGDFFGCLPRFRDAMATTSSIHGITAMKVSSLSEAWAQVVHNVETLTSETDLLFSLGLVSLILLPVLKFRGHRWVWSSSLIAYLFLTQLWGDTTGRLFSINAGVLVLLIASTISEVTTIIRERNRSIANAVFPLVGILFLASFFFVRVPLLRGPGVDWRGGVTLTEESRKEWLIERGVRTADLFEMEAWMKTHVPPEDEVYVAPNGYLTSLRRRFIASDKFFGEQLNQWIQDGTVNNRLGDLGADWILIDRIENTDFWPPGLMEQLEGKWVLVKRAGSWKLFRKSMD